MGIVSIEGYDFLRADRDRNGGGVDVFIKDAMWIIKIALI